MSRTRRYLVAAIEGDDTEDTMSEVFDGLVAAYNARTGERAFLHAVADLPTVDAARSALTECSFMLRQARKDFPL